MSEIKTTTMSPITLTKGAVRELKRIQTSQNLAPEYGLRVGVKGGGCAGFSYILGFDVQKDDDQVYDIHGMKVLMQKAHGL